MGLQGDPALSFAGKRQPSPWLLPVVDPAFLRHGFGGAGGVGWCGVGVGIGNGVVGEDRDTTSVLTTVH